MPVRGLSNETAPAGILAQELAATNPVIQAAGAEELRSWTENVKRLLAAAKKKRKMSADFDPKAVAWFLNSLWQGSMLVGKASESQAMIRSNLKLPVVSWTACFCQPELSSPASRPTLTPHP